MIFNRVIGTGYAYIRFHHSEAEVACVWIRIYATPSLILQSCGSVGLSLVMWFLGALIAAAGTAVFIELGTVRICFGSNLLELGIALLRC